MCFERKLIFKKEKNAPPLHCTAVYTLVALVHQDVYCWCSLYCLADEVSRKEEIEKFLEANKQMMTNGMKDVQVTTMRHILPQLLMETYSEQYQHYTGIRKGKQLLDW